MTEAQIQLQNALTTTFLSNLAFLSEYDNELYQRVDELSRMIERGDYVEKYALEFLMENGEFDIYDILNDKYLYGKKPNKFNNELIRKVEQHKNNYILDIAGYFSSEIKREEPINRDYRFELDYLKQLNKLTIEDLGEYIDITEDFLKNKEKKLKNVKKFIFIGTLLGRHIPAIAKQVDANMYLVLEKNLEIFRLSLFTVDYTILANKGLIFSIMDNIIDAEVKIANFIRTSYLENYLIKFSTTSINIEEYVDTILNLLQTFSPSGYDYNRRLYTHINRTTKYIENGYKFILFNKLKENLEFFNKLPILYLAAGPSLDENLEWIKKNQNKFFIITLGASYKKMIENNIRIDIIVTLDDQYNILDKKQFDNETVSKISSNTIILASSMTNEKILNKFNQNNLFLYEVFNNIHKDNISSDGFSVGEIALNIILLLNAKEIYLIGLDLSLNQDTGETHSKNASSGTLKIDLKEKQNRDSFNLRKSLIKVKGNLKEIVYTTPLFYSSIKSIEEKIITKRNDVNVYNLSKNGAYFEGVIPKRIEEINIDFLKEHNIEADLFLDNLRINSINKLTSDTKRIIKLEIEFIESNVLEHISKILDKNYETFDQFVEDILAIPTDLFDNNYKNFFQVLINYYQMVLPYLLYYFNDVKFKAESKKVIKIKSIFMKQLKNIVLDYKILLERVV